MEGDRVLWKGRFLSYTPVLIKSVSTLFSLEAQIRVLMGTPICLA